MLNIRRKFYLAFFGSVVAMLMIYGIVTLEMVWTYVEVSEAELIAEKASLISTEVESVPARIATENQFDDPRDRQSVLQNEIQRTLQKLVEQHGRRRAIFISVDSPDVWASASRGFERSITDLIKASVFAKPPFDAEAALEAENLILIKKPLTGAIPGYIYIVGQRGSLANIVELLAPRFLPLALLLLWLGFWGAWWISSYVLRKTTEAAERIIEAQGTDTLTGLPIESRLRYFFEQSDQKRVAPRPLFITLNVTNFSDLRTSFGGSVAQAHLNQVLALIRDLLPAGYQMGRRDDGRILITYRASPREQEAHQICERIAELASRNITVESLDLSIGLSIGFATADSGSTDFDDLVSFSGDAERLNRGRRLKWSAYEPVDRSSRIRRLKRAAELYPALQAGHFHVFYQPKYSLKTQRLQGAEALIRWIHPSEGVLSPAEFIDQIQNSSHRREFTRFVIKRAVSVLASQHKRGIANGFSIAVNMSGYDLCDEGMVEFISETLASADVPPYLFIIELLEDDTARNQSEIAGRLAELRDLGVNIAIDDFGTGMSSLSYLENMPLNILKIDRSFVKNIDSSHSAMTLVQSVMNFAHTFGWKVVAEGIETPMQARLLKELGCDLGQGYLFAKPMPEKDFLELCRNSLTQQPFFSESLTEGIPHP